MSYKPFEPLNDWIVVMVVDETDEAGAIIPKKYRQQSNKAVVIAVPQGSDCPLKPRDRVLYGQYNTEKFSKDGVNLELVRVADIRGVERFDA